MAPVAPGASASGAAASESGLEHARQASTGQARDWSRLATGTRPTRGPRARWKAPA